MLFPEQLREHFVVQCRVQSRTQFATQWTIQLRTHLPTQFTIQFTTRLLMLWPMLSDEQCEAL